MTSISASRKLVVILVLTTVLAGLVAGSGYYYNGNGGNGIITSTGSSFGVPQFSSQQELLTQLVAPFIFIAILLQFAFAKVFHFILHDDDFPENVSYPIAIREGRPDVSKYSMLMSLTVTAMLVPSPFWDYVRLSIQLMGVIPIVVLLGMFFWIAFKVL